MKHTPTIFRGAAECSIPRVAAEAAAGAHKHPGLSAFGGLKFRVYGLGDPGMKRDGREILSHLRSFRACRGLGSGI